MAAWSSSATRVRLRENRTLWRYGAQRGSRQRIVETADLGSGGDSKSKVTVNSVKCSTLTRAVAPGGAQAAPAVGQHLRQHGHHAVGEIDGVPPNARLAVQRRAGPHIGRDIGDGDDPSGFGYVWPGKPFGIAAAIPFFVVAIWNIQCRSQIINGHQHFERIGGMLAHNDPLFFRQFAGFEQDLIRDSQFAYVVE
mgnify:CR=1 FL=1